MDVLKSRLIYTAGTFSITPELAACRRLIITSTVLRFPPTTSYSNERSNPPKFFLGYAGFFINNYCEKILPLEFDPQAVLVYDNLAIQLYYAILCTGKLGADNLAGLAALLTPPVILLPTPFIAAPFPGCPYTSIKLKLVFGTRLEVNAVGDPVVSCDGISVNASLPDLLPPDPKYPEDRARSEDPARSTPEEGELPGDTAPATTEDPDLSLQPQLGQVSGIAGSGITGTYVPRTGPPIAIASDPFGQYIITYEFFAFFAGENAYSVLVNGVNADPGSGYRLNSASWTLL